MRLTRTLAVALALLSLPQASPLRADTLTSSLQRDPVARNLQKLLKTAFSDIEADVRLDTRSACATIEKASITFTPAMIEYASHTGDNSFFRQLQHWHHLFCGDTKVSPLSDEE